VPQHFRNILFIAFHTNPVGGHLNPYRTLHRLRLRYYWPGMYSYVKRMCSACPGCALSNPTKAKSSELVYNFPIEAPFMVLHVDVYMAGARILVSKDPKPTSLLVVVCARLELWSPSPVPMQPHLPLQS
jgi:hypothetical protein